MRTRFLVCLFVLSLLGASATVIVQGRALPDRVATHFNADGKPDDWSTRPSEVALFLAFLTVGTPLFIVGTTYVARFRGPETLHVPNAAHWRSLENHPVACAILFRYGLVLGAASAWWSVLVHAHVVAANQNGAAALNLAGLLVLLGAVITVWLGVLCLRFLRIPGMP